ncbi:NnrU family protein [Methylopila musalis]|uniref:NnrU family protein n=1 Tax=Methylopila musalis TaxID=1134781 RepID=A0ABW3Z8B8_9HYPH
MTLLVAGLLLFIGVHLATRARDGRARLIARFGEPAYKIGYSALSTLALALIVYGYSHALYVGVWTPPAWTRHIPAALMLPAFILLVSAYVPGRIRAAAKHPMLAAVKLWAFAHLAANGDLASILLFGGLLAYGVIARILIKRRERKEGPAAAPAPVDGRNDIVAVAIGVVLYGVFGAFLHPILIGVPAFGS